jgi:hypothetical protein
LLTGKIVRSPPVLKNQRMKSELGRRSWAKSFNCCVSFDLLSSLTATSEPSSENLSPLPISESDSTCNAVEPAIEADEPARFFPVLDTARNRFYFVGREALSALPVPKQIFALSVLNFPFSRRVAQMADNNIDKEGS